jgi:hypothetical protein
MTAAAPSTTPQGAGPPGEPGASNRIDQMVELLTSGVAGVPLANELLKRLRGASRWEVALAVGLAVSEFEADRLLLIYDLKIAEGELAAMKAQQSDG